MKKVALVLHGWPQHRFGNHFLITYLKNKGYEVLTPDLFGLGRDFSIGNIQNFITNKTVGEEPDLIIGISLGGIILPFIAKDFPEAKLIFIATGPRLKAKPVIFNLLIKLTKYRIILYLGEIILKLPKSLLAFIYKKASPFSGSDEEKKEYEDDMYKNIDFIKGIPVSKEVQIVNFVIKVDSSKVLAELENRSLIFNGKHDLFMPEERGRRLHSLLRNSKLVINDGEHFDVFTSKDLPEIDKFLNIN